MKTFIYKKTFFFLAILSNHFLIAQTSYITLQGATDLALMNNKSLSVQILEEQKQKEITNEFKGKLRPSVALNGSVSHYFDRQVIFLPGTFLGTQNKVEDVRVGGLNTINSSVTIQQPLLLGNLKNQKKVALTEEKIAKKNTDEIKSQLLFLVTKEYYGIQLMKSQLQLHQKSLARNQKALQDTKSLLAAGRALKVDTLRSYIAVENLKSSVSFLNNNIKVATLNFKKLIGIEESIPIELTDAMTLENESERFALLQQNEENGITKRNDIQRQILNIEKDQQVLSANKSNQYPQISLIGQYQLQAQADDGKITAYSFPMTGFLGLQLTLPIFNGGSLNAQVRQSKIKIQQEKLQLEDQKEEANLELKTIANNWKNAKNRLEIQKRTVEAAEINYTINNNRYLNNLSSMLEVNDAELALNTAHHNLLLAIYELKVLTVAYEKALGKF